MENLHKLHPQFFLETFLGGGLTLAYGPDRDRDVGSRDQEIYSFEVENLSVCINLVGIPPLLAALGGRPYLVRVLASKLRSILLTTFVRSS